MSKKKRKQNTIKNIIIILIIIFLILVLNKCTITEEHYSAENIPVTKTEEIEHIIENCSNMTYEWGYSWGGWFPETNNEIKTRFTLQNMEDIAGLFVISFAFFDNTIHPFSDYEGINYDNVREELPWDQASMHLNNIEKYLGPGETILLTPSAKKKNSTGVYWIYADVGEPTYEKCTTMSIYESKNRTTLERKKVQQNTTSIVPLWKYLIYKIKN